MRLITYRKEGEERLGAWIDGDRQVVELAAAARLKRGQPWGAAASMQALIDAGPGAWDEARALVERPPAEAVVPSAACALLAPLPRPLSLRDSVCFPEHLAGAQRMAGERIARASPDPARKRAELEAAGFFQVPKAFYEFPVYYLCNTLSVVGTGADIEWPPYSRFIDYELEWAAVIGLEGRRIARDQAARHIFGYTVFNDWSARDEQLKVMAGAINLGPGQGKDFCNGLGPCIVTADELRDPYALTMTARVDGETYSRGSTATMHYRFEDLIVHFTRGHALYPGELLASGTVGGGCCVETGRVIRPGQVVELEVEGIGVLRNRVVAPHFEQGARVSPEQADGLARMLKR